MTRRDESAGRPGHHYILLVGATDADVFGNPTPSAINAALPEAGRKMVAIRVGERVNITTLDGFHRDYEAANSKSPLGVGGHNVVSYLVHAPSGPNSTLRLWPPVKA